MSTRQLRARLDRLEARFPQGDEESIARHDMMICIAELGAGKWNYSRTRKRPNIMSYS
jgi:hypothetical protein